ncbi:MAG: hypothetical protein FGM15_11525 [Chthoniobacterales bacterium]|nr:hypothetical protein [Chthoniobacterales bacterium]
MKSALFSSPRRFSLRVRSVPVILLAVLLASLQSASALETVMQDDFGLPNGSQVDPAKWTVNSPGIYMIIAGSGWNCLQGSLTANAAEAYAEVAGFSGKDFIVEFDLNRFPFTGNYFDLVLRQNTNGNTRVRFAANAANKEISVAIMEPGSESVSTNLGTTSFNLGQYDWVSFRVRINDSRVQVFTKRPWEPEFTLLGQYAPATPTYINSGAGTVRLLLPQSAFTNYVNIDSFKVRQADSGKKVFADFHGYRYTRENDGQLGNWKQEARSPEAPNHIANYNADLVDDNGNNQLAGPGNPAVGMQSYNDPDYAEYHVLTAKMAGIDGFLHEYGCPAGLTADDVQLLQATSEKYGMEFGIHWLDAFYYGVIQTDATYKAWCTANGKDPNSNASKFAYIPQLFQQLINRVYDKTNAATIGGKPLMPIFQGSPLTPSDFATLKTNTYTYKKTNNVPHPFVMPRQAPVGLLAAGNPNDQKFWSDPSGWETQTDGSFGWKPATERATNSLIYQKWGDERDATEFARAHVEGMLKNTNDRVNMAGVMPGFDNKYNAAWGQWIVELLDRKGGLTYSNVWEQYLRDRDVIDAVFIPTWSDHTEGSGIEPMTDYGDRELRTTAKYSAQFKGLPDPSASLDFTLPKQLFELRKMVKFLEAAGYPASPLKTESDKLDTAGQEIAAASAASYTAAANRLAAVRAQLQAWRDTIVSTTYTHSYFTNVEAVVSNGVNQNIDIPEATSSSVRGAHFDGVITFEYLDNSTFAANKNLYLFANPFPASTDKPGEWRVCQMQLRHGNGDGQWKTARVKLNKKNLPLTAGVDLYFSALGGASNGGTVRNVTVSLTTYEYNPPTASVASGNWNAPATWSKGKPSSGSPAGIVHTVTFQDGDEWTGGAWTKGLLIGYDSWGSNWSLPGSGSGVLNVTGGNLTTGYLGLGAGLNGGTQTGTLNISGGVVTANDTMLIGWSTAGGSSVNVSGGTLNLTGNAPDFVVGHGGTAAMNVSGGTVNLERSLNLKNNSTLQIGGTGLFRIANGGSLSATSGSITVANGGTLELATGVSLAASATLNGGTLKFAGSSPATIASNNITILLSNSPTIHTVGDSTIAALLSGSGGISSGITKTGPGALFIANPGNNYTGQTSIMEGTLSMSNAGLADGADVRIAAGATLNLTHNATDTIRRLYINGVQQLPGTWGGVGSGATNQSSAITGTGLLQVTTGPVTGTWNGTASTSDLLNSSNWVGNAVPASSTNTTTGRQDVRWDGLVPGPLNLTFGSAFGGNFGVGLVMTADQTGAVTLANSASTNNILRLFYSSSSSATNASIQIASGAGALTIGAPGTGNPITLFLGEGSTIRNYYFANNSTNTATIEQNVMITKGGSANATLYFNAGNWDVKGVVSDLAAGLLRVDAGTVTLSASNTFTGGVRVGAGTLAIGNNNALGSGVFNIANSAATIRSADATARTIANAMTLGTDATFGSAGTGNLTFTGPVNWGTGAKNVTVTNGITTEFSGSVTNTGDRVKLGTGTLLLSGDNSASSFNLYVNEGTLAFTSASALGSSTNAVRLGQTTTSGVLRYTGSGDTTISRLMRVGNGTNTTFNGSATIQNDGSGTLTFNNATFNEAGIAAVARTLTLRGTNTGNNTISGAIVNNTGATVALIKSDTGTWILSGSNSFSGGVNIDLGTLVVGNSNALGSGTVNLRADATNEVARLRSDGTDRIITNAITFGGNSTAQANYLGGIGSGKLTFNGGVFWGSSSKTYTIDGSTVEFGGAWTGSNATTINTIDGTGVATSLLILSGDRGTAAKEINIGNGLTVRANNNNSFGSDNTEPLGILGGANTSVVELENNITLARTLTVQGRDAANANVAVRNLAGNNSLALDVAAGGTRYNIESQAGMLTITNISGITGDCDLFVTGAGNVTLPNWNGRRDLTMNGAGTLTLKSTSSPSGDVWVNSGKLNLDHTGTSTIRSLYLNGAKQAAGTWGAVDSGAQHESSAITGTGRLLVTEGGNNFGVWASASGIDGEPPTGDYDSDGIPNLAEYALGLNPTVAEGAAGTFNGRRITYSKGAAASANGDVTYFIETRTDLVQGSWTQATEATDSASEISYEPDPSVDRIFVRLRVVQTN